VIFFKFNLVPKNITFDEVDFAKLALSLDGKPYTPYSNLATGHSTLYFYILLSSFKAFGVNNFALRFPAALFGVLGVIMFYLLMEKVFKKNHFIVFLTALIFATSRWYFNFARFSFEATFLLFLELTSLYFLFKSDKPGLSWIMSGAFAGLAFNSYTPGRFFFIIPLVYITSVYFRKRKELVKNILYLIVPFLIVITPLTTYLLTHQDNRVDKLFFWKNHEMTLGEKVSGTLSNIYTVSSMFVYQGDMSGKHNYPGKPALNPLIGLLFIAGMILALRRFKDTNNKLFLAFLFISVLPSFMIYPWENPNMLRTFTAIPAVVYFVGLTLQQLFEKKKYLMIAMALSFVLVMGSSIYELRTYFVYQAKVFPSAFETKPTLEESLKHINFNYDKDN
jgi:4-amino-4-deoxy-L-arabinose transferase-like glycosyltransferase